MKLVFLVLSAYFAFNATAMAQAQDVPMSVERLSEGPVISLSNTHPVDVEAFLVTVDSASTNKPLTRLYYDVHANYKHDVVIPPGMVKRIPLPHVEGKELPVPTLRAVVFSDGTSAGDNAWVQELLHKRTILSDRIEEVMALLREVSDRDLSREESLDLLEKARRSRREASGNGTPEERLWNDQIFYMAIRNLQGTPGKSGRVTAVPTMVKALSKVLKDWLGDLQSARPEMRRRVGPRPVEREPARP